jgi:glycosyltransferase involved in cell wall biosynthesis
MHWIREHGIDLTIFSLMPPKDTVRSQQAEDLVALGRYSAVFSWKVARSQMHFLRRSPLRYLRAFGRLVWQTYREPKVMLLMMGLFPKIVHFAHQMEDEGIDHIHAHFVWLEGIAAGVAKDLLGVTFSIHPHAFGLFSRNQRDVRRELENASHVVTISEYHRRFIHELAPRIASEGVDVVHCGIEPDRVQPPEQRVPNDPPRILSVGRAVEKKGHEYLIEGCAELLARGRSLRCDVVVGSGGRRDRLQARIEELGIGDSVTLLDTRDEDGIFELLREVDIFALACVVAESGDRDGVPVSLMEAMACELPVVSTPVTGIPELVVDGETGLIVPERDAVALADALDRLLDDEQLRGRLGRKGRAKVLEEFNVQISAARMADIFRTVSRGV